MVTINLDQPIFSVPHVAGGIPGASVETIRSWLKRGHLDGPFVPDSARSGFLSARRALQISVIYSIIRCGMSATKASVAAAKWTDTGTPERPPAALYRATTYLVVRPGIDDPDGQVVAEHELTTFCSDGAVIVVNLTVLRDSMFKHLGLTA